MTKLTDTHLVILSAACQQPDRLVLPLPAHIRGGAVKKVVTGLLTRGLVEEAKAGRDAPVWRETGDGHGVTLVATDAAFEALGIEREAVRDQAAREETAAGAPAGFEAAPVEAASTEAAPAVQDTSPEAPPVRKTRDGTKQAQLIAMLRRSQGATIAQLVEAADWRPHTVRGFFAGALKKRLGLTVTSEKVDGTRVYRLPPA